MSLEPIAPAAALDLYLADREPEVSQATLYSHRSRLGHFVRWCQAEGIENLNDVTGRRLHEFRLWRRREGDLNTVTEKTQMDTLRVFIRWLESIDGVEQDLSTKVQSPTLDKHENARDVLLSHDRAEAILTYLGKYEYGSIPHVSITLIWHTAMRIGAVHALDLDDYDASEQYVSVHHRPETDTPIKNKEDGERFIALSADVCGVLDDWVADQRSDVTDDYGRRPLITTSTGRIHQTTLRSHVYAWTRPCMIGAGCPHDRDPAVCDATSFDTASECPSSVSPHPIRRGSITHSLNSDVPPRVVADRANVSLDVIDEHYDRRTEKEKMEQRRGFLNNI